MKKLLLMFTAIFAVVGLIGCGNEGTSGNTSKNSNKVDDGRVEIKLWQDNDKYAEAIIPKIEEALPHIKIVYEKVATGGAAEKLDLDGPAGLGPDIMWNTPESMAKAMQSGILLPLGEKLSASIQERMLNGSVQSVTANDTVYGLPISVESLALVYNKTLLEENGLEVATTFEQIIEDSKTYNDFKSNKFLLRFQSWETYHSLIFLTAAGYELFGPDGYDIDSVNLNTPEVIEGLKQLQKVQEILPIPSKELTWETVNGEFVKGLVPYMITGPWAFEDIQKINEEDKFEWGVTTIPTIDGNQPRTFLGNITATISAYTKHPEEAREVLEFMGSDEGLQVMYDVMGKLPALKDLSNIEGVMDDPYLMGVSAQAQYAFPMPMVGELPFFYDVADVMFQSVWDGLTTPEEAAAKAEKDFYTTVEISK